MKNDDIIDLSAPVGKSTRLFPGMSPVTLRRLKNHEEDGVQTSRLEMSVHAGTHVDAPLHFVAGAGDLAALPLSRLCGEALMADLRFKTPGAAIEPADLETTLPGIEPGDIVVLNTGFEKVPDNRHFCYVTEAAARWLVDRRIKALAMDMLSVDPVTDDHQRSAASHPAHHILLGAGIPLVETLVNLDRLCAGRFYFVCLPLHLEDSEAAPARAAAFLYPESKKTS